MLFQPFRTSAILACIISLTAPAVANGPVDTVESSPASLNVDVVPLALPVLKGNDTCPLVRLDIQATGEHLPISLSRIVASLDGTTDIADLASLQIHCGGTNNRLSQAAIGAELDVTAAAAKRITFKLDQKISSLREGTNHIWITATLNDNADIDHRVGISCRSVEFSDKSTTAVDHPTTTQRLGIALRNHGDDDVHTYRIPGLATTNKGTLIGVYDIRHNSHGDLPGHIDVGMSRSTNGGITWDDMVTIMDMGDDPNWHYDGIGDPAVLVDRNTGTIWVAALWSHGNQGWKGSGPGMLPEETGQIMLTRSDDDGITWSQPINITNQIKDPSWCLMLQGPGNGITMHDGTLVFAAQFQDTPQNQRMPRSTIIYSRDHGDTWHTGTGAFHDTTEAQVVEIEPGVLMLNCRYDLEDNRVVMVTRDMGQTWTEHPTSRKTLIEPTSCMASLISINREPGQNGNSWLLFSNPNSHKGRNHMTIKASSDNGMTWPTQHQLLIDEGNSAGYSCLTMIDEHTIGILYEGSQSQLTFQRIPLNDLKDE